MSKEKYYFEEGAESCYDKQYFIEQMQDNKQTEIYLYETVPEFGGEYMWCKMEGEIVVRGEGSCGKNNCGDYEPCNGKNGRCRHLGCCYTYGKQVILNVNGEMKDYING